MTYQERLEAIGQASRLITQSHRKLKEKFAKKLHEKEYEDAIMKACGEVSREMHAINNEAKAKRRALLQLRIR